MNSVKTSMPLWKWIMLIIFGSALFLFLSQTVPVVGSFSNNIWIKVILMLLGAASVLGIYAAWVKVFEKRKVSELYLRRALPDLLTGLLIGSLFITVVVGVLAEAGSAIDVLKMLSGVIQKNDGIEVFGKGVDVVQNPDLFIQVCARQVPPL